MLNIYRTSDKEIYSVGQDENVFDCWYHLCAPTSSELQQVIAQTGASADFLRASLDDDERSRIEVEDGQTLILVDTPIEEKDDSKGEYITIPLGIIMMEKCLITVCLKDPPLIRDFYKGRVQNFSTKKHNRFVLQLLYRNAAKFLHYLRHMYKMSIDIENELHKSMRNKELIDMLQLEKSLVYFSTSLKGNEVVLERLLRMSFVREYPDDTDLLEDVIIENKQAIEMCTIYRDILGGTMDAFSSVISNNLNMIMKVLTVITMILTIPTIIASLWGMNVPVPFEGSEFGFWIVIGIAVLISAVVGVVLKFKKMF